MLERQSLNYHHLYYFWVVAREGGIARASETLDVASSTISTQLSLLEESLSVKLFHRAGRSLVLSEAGRTALKFAEEIFSLGRDLTETLRNPKSHQPLRLAVGVADVVPKLVATKFLEPAVEMGVHLVCREGQPAKLLADMALHLLDVVLLDAPVGSASNIRAFSHRLSSSALKILGAPGLAQRYRDGFPASLDGAPFLLPTHESFLRPVLERWFDEHAIRPEVVGEFDDTALIKAFGVRSAGLLATPALIWPQVQSQYGLEEVGQLDAVRISFYAATLDRRVEHAAVTRMLEAAS
ncbi:MAG: LysR family transcriptional regulator [Acidobacteriota bacterium]